MNQAIKILIAEDHPVVAEGYANLLKDSADFHTVGIAGTAQEVYHYLKTQKIDVLLLDLVLPNIRLHEYSQLAGYDILDFIKTNNIDVRVIVLSSHEEPSFIVKAQSKGAMGYLSKKVDRFEIREAIRRVELEKKEYIQKHLLSQIIDNTNTDGITLTQRERSILIYISEGLTSKQIADKLSLANDTIRDYREGLIKKFGAKNSVNLVKIASENGYLIQL
ncbi:response regulator transcription factor [Pseudarcicella hirudinis]|nr:response regulator transcription factor [Pseudarcicella hirudinis]